MRRLLLSLPLLFMPFIAAGQSAASDPYDMAGRMLMQQPDQMAQVGPGVAVPLWQGADGRWLALQASNDTLTAAQRADAPLQFRAVDAASVLSSDVQYGLGSNLQAHVGVSEHNWANNDAPRIVGSEVGATYNAGRYSVGLSLGADTVPGNNANLPRLLPGATPGVNGLPGFDSSTQLNARGRLALDSKSGIDLGASVGRVRLLPGNLLGVSTLDQKALSFGVDRGPLSGSIVGRTMQPEAGGMPGAAYNPERRWSSIDLGVTWRLPWQGQLSIGAQNVWSSGNAVNTPAGPEPDQARTPYVQYHQDL
ncbi:hypothetical protein DVT68_06290 [Dyella solisilvae]|uniref:Uncharacterized protein n=1 Tax=Dyella solisilvae TaxID=1920168 RepID=A0A370KCM5_9GAMM|nr:hypothetical protein [Dyella solisilvae]RDJ00406.1 hypothetical protein DVT68_06290 [Dyella solisilvae]